jgi:hypothetical protein
LAVAFEEELQSLKIKVIEANESLYRAERSRDQMADQLRRAKSDLEQAIYHRNQAQQESQALRGKLGDQNQLRQSVRSLTEPLHRIATEAAQLRELSTRSELIQVSGEELAARAARGEAAAAEELEWRKKRREVKQRLRDATRRL